jgi:hypothetical protein
VLLAAEEVGETMDGQKGMLVTLDVIMVSSSQYRPGMDVDLFLGRTRSFVAFSLQNIPKEKPRSK